jgi:organic hydroperoxide reductase OsmC/OhrA
MAGAAKARTSGGGAGPAAPPSAGESRAMAEPKSPRTHRYKVRTVWTGETRGYRSYSRDHRIEVTGKPPIAASADPAFRGTAERYNPEDMLVASLSACHMLWYLHLCAVGGVVVLGYEDAAEGVLAEAPGAGRFTEVTLRPVVIITADSDAETARTLHKQAHKECFVANSVNFPVRCEPTIVRQRPDAGDGEDDADV